MLFSTLLNKAYKMSLVLYLVLMPLILLHLLPHLRPSHCKHQVQLLKVQ